MSSNREPLINVAPLYVPVLTPDVKAATGSLRALLPQHFHSLIHGATGRRLAVTRERLAGNIAGATRNVPWVAVEETALELLSAGKLKGMTEQGVRDELKELRKLARRHTGYDED